MLLLRIPSAAGGISSDELQCIHLFRQCGQSHAHCHEHGCRYSRTE